MIWIGNTLVSAGEPGVYGERVLSGHRVWDPYRSKLAALYHLGKGVEITGSTRVLYLGAAHGTTVSHVSDYAEVVYAVEIAPLPMQDLLDVAGRRGNIIPVMADAAHPEEYAPVVEEVDLVFQDVASPLQAEIAIRNRSFLSRDGRFILVVKTRSIDTTARPETVEGEVIRALLPHFTILDSTWLSPFHRDHVAFICKR
ncbi:MAG TPA: fibrillarin-like rRNA/tRNA 2'-O-methyltransferase [Methanomicrobiales archaeon]|nr:fibrillarin-like rRNA/tRNA 2'-O-methyltransferase [Methanomicrobiales archaeon]